MAITIFSIHISDLHNATNYSEIQLFADDENLFYSSNSLKDIEKKVNFDLKNIVQWLRANKISLNTDKTEIILLRAKKVETENI